MSSLRNVLVAAAVVGLSFSSTQAEARFGKRSSSSSTSDNKSKVHDASAVGEESSSDSDDDDSGDSSSYSPPPRSEPSNTVGAFFTLLEILADTAPQRAEVVSTPAVVGELPATARTSEMASDPSAEVKASAPEKLSSNVRLGADAAAMGGGTGVSLFLAFEGERMGMDVRGTELTLPTDDGTAGHDSITLAGLHLTYAVLARENLRIRIEGGLSGAQAPDLSVAAPSFAVSLEGCLLPVVDVEARLQATPFPYQQIDAQAGLALRLQALVVRGGWRALYLNDNGLVDGESHSDAFGGPFVGAGFTF